MAIVRVRALKVCFNANNQLVQVGGEFDWVGDPEKMDSYLEPVGEPREAGVAQAPSGRRTPQQADDRNHAILSALTKLDPAEDSHWTAQGLPSLDAVRDFAGDATVTRAEVKTIAPEVMRPV